MNYQTTSVLMKTANNLKALVAHAQILILALLCIWCFGLSSVAQTQIPEEPKGHVNDFAGLLSQTEQTRLENNLRNYRDSTTNVISIAIVENLAGYTKEQYATELFNKWKMWHEDRYNGILILVAQEERAIRIETGYGLEGAFPDAVANRVIDEIITPEFKNNHYYNGLNKATSAIMRIVAGEYSAVLEQGKQRGGGENEFFEIIKVVAFFGFIFFFIISMRNKKRGGGGSNGGSFRGRRRRPHSIGSGGIFIGSGGFNSGGRGGGFSSGGGFGGFSGGGGFGSGGGGAGGSW